MRAMGMFTAINRFIVNCSHSWFKFLLIVLAFGGTMFGLQNITAAFPDVTNGDVPFDMQNDLQPDEVFTQLAGYSEQAFSLYAQFQVIAYFFPIAAGLMLAVICAFALRVASPARYSQANNKNLFILLLIPTVFDWLENIFLLWAVSAWPNQATQAATLAVAAKMGKLGTMQIAFAVTGALLLWALIAWLRRRLAGTA